MCDIQCLRYLLGGIQCWRYLSGGIESWRYSFGGIENWRYFLAVSRVGGTFWAEEAVKPKYGGIFSAVMQYGGGSVLAVGGFSFFGGNTLFGGRRYYQNMAVSRHIAGTTHQSGNFTAGKIPTTTHPENKATYSYHYCSIISQKTWRPRQGPKWRTKRRGGTLVAQSLFLAAGNSC